MEVFENCSNLIGCKYLLVADTRLCHLLGHKGGKVKIGCSCLLPYVQKLAKGYNLAAMAVHITLT